MLKTTMMRLAMLWLLLAWTHCRYLMSLQLSKPSSSYIVSSSTFCSSQLGPTRPSVHTNKTWYQRPCLTPYAISVPLPETTFYTLHKLWCCVTLLEDVPIDLTRCSCFSQSNHIALKLYNFTFLHVLYSILYIYTHYMMMLLTRFSSPSSGGCLSGCCRPTLWPSSHCQSESLANGQMKKEDGDGGTVWGVRKSTEKKTQKRNSILQAGG